MPEIKKLRDKVRELLLLEWDPIGIRDATRAHDEYDSYVLPIARAILERRTVTELRDQLLTIEVERMRLDGDANRALSVATKLAELQGRPEDLPRSV